MELVSWDYDSSQYTESHKSHVPVTTNQITIDRYGTIEGIIDEI
jgi:hypothetical protein